MRSRIIYHKNNKMESEIKVSVVIPLYNKENEVARAVKSVLNQSVQPEELIVVDDGSTDASSEVVHSLFYNVSFLKLIRQDNSGVSAARNNGIKASTCQYVILLDADDELYQNHIEEKLKAIEKFPDAILYCNNFVKFDGVNNIPYPVNVGNSDIFILSDFIEIYSSNYGVINSSSVCLNKYYFDDRSLAFPIGIKKGEDIYFWLKCSMVSEVVYVDKILSKIYLDAGNRHKSDDGLLPYNIKWFYDNHLPLTSKLRAFNRKNFCIHFYIYCIEKQRKNIKSAFNIAFRRDVKLFFLLIVIFVIPNFILYHFKKIYKKRL